MNNTFILQDWVKPTTVDVAHAVDAPQRVKPVTDLTQRLQKDVRFAIDSWVDCVVTLASHAKHVLQIAALWVAVNLMTPTSVGANSMPENTMNSTEVTMASESNETTELVSPVESNDLLSEGRGYVFKYIDEINSLNPISFIDLNKNFSDIEKVLYIMKTKKNTPDDMKNNMIPVMQSVVKKAVATMLDIKRSGYASNFRDNPEHAEWVFYDLLAAAFAKYDVDGLTVDSKRLNFLAKKNNNSEENNAVSWFVETYYMSSYKGVPCLVVKTADWQTLIVQANFVPAESKETRLVKYWENSKSHQKFTVMINVTGR